MPLDGLEGEKKRCFIEGIQINKETNGELSTLGYIRYVCSLLPAARRSAVSESLEDVYQDFIYDSETAGPCCSLLTLSAASEFPFFLESTECNLMVHMLKQTEQGNPARGVMCWAHTSHK